MNGFMEVSILAALYEDKCTGAFLAAAIGDALGWPFENKSNNQNKKPLTNGRFQSWTRKSGGMYWAHTETIEEGEYSDDTQLLLAVARSLTYGKKWNQYFIKQELPFWLSYERGGGNAIKSAVKAWSKRNGNPWSNINSPKDVAKYYNAGANGVAMRILPHVIYNLESDNVDELMEIVLKNGMYTHGHPRALLGATCYAYALYIAGRKTQSLEYGELIDLVLNGSDIWGKLRSILPEWYKLASTHLKKEYSEIWNECVWRICDNLKSMQDVIKSGILSGDEDYLKSIGCLSSNTNGAGDVSALTAIYFASKYAANPKQAIMAAAYLKGSDTDTNASMTGALVGMVQGTEWIPYDWLSVQDHNYIKSLSRKLLMHIEEIINTNESDMLPDEYMSLIGKIKRIGGPKTFNGKNYSVFIQKSSTEWGQTIYVKSFEKKINQENPKLDAEKRNKSAEHLSILSDNEKLIDLLSELSKVDDKINICKLLNVIQLIQTTQLSDKEIYDLTKVKKKTISWIRIKFL